MMLKKNFLRIIIPCFDLIKKNKLTFITSWKIYLNLTLKF